VNFPPSSRLSTGGGPGGGGSTAADVDVYKAAAGLGTADHNMLLEHLQGGASGAGDGGGGASGGGGAGGSMLPAFGFTQEQVDH